MSEEFWSDIRAVVLAQWSQWSQPANVILSLMLLAIGFLVIRAQRRPDVDFVEMLRADGKIHWAKCAAIGAFGVSSYCTLLCFVTPTLKDIATMVLFSYLLAWSGSDALLTWLKSRNQGAGQ
jgi:hypothetical protein